VDGNKDAGGRWGAGGGVAGGGKTMTHNNNTELDQGTQAERKTSRQQSKAQKKRKVCARTDNKTSLPPDKQAQTARKT